MTKVALIDDHSLIRNALGELISRFDDYEVTHQASNGKEFISSLDMDNLPDVALVDINMPVMDGFKTAEALSKEYPSIKIMALSVEDEEESIIKMLRCGAKGYLLKDSDTQDLRLALDELSAKGYYHSDLVANTLLSSLNGNKKATKVSQIHYQAREFEFLQMACSELTYKEIADRMCISPRTVDGYRENLFYKLDVKSRVGMVLFAIKNGIVEV
ncbi:response regulator [Arcticibacterium luteifluviistationis]|uniref:DNA-binding response regulator n=1 Tax=Arcticibacterium luteifluviistationis TaxID=1784714 RepID=A0A2Z4GA29_9BACT|nr:response regulator transcription factor [Arcticibacterium luteifluviistationis]AWV97908.1 DNA-binding response regulator [Arcticibacterium luteifluviistationis]